MITCNYPNLLHNCFQNTIIKQNNITVVLKNSHINAKYGICIIKPVVQHMVTLGCLHKKMSDLLQWSVLWHCDLQVAGSNPVGTGCGELFEEVAIKN